MYHHTKIGCKWTSSSEEIVESHILIICAFTVISNLKTANQRFCMTLLLMMMPHHTKFGNKTFCSSEDIICKNDLYFEPRCTLTLSTAIYFLQDMPAYDNATSSKFGCKRISTSDDVEKNKS